ncbi:MAG: DUF1850 domain-containing protein [Synergistaceae bacterium]|jgi:hypothetical protein|nr:DUF1850 domain-containing protein [Synergistaceae bacterium]
MEIPSISAAARAVTVVLCAALLLAEMPVNYIEIAGDGVRLASPVPHGAPFTTAYVHSVEKTPVIELYRIADGKIWVWEEMVRSHNAGLPFDAPEHGSFIMEGSGWMIVRGGRRAMESIAYRVGNADIGQNRWHLPPYFVKAYEKYPSRRVFIESGVRKFRDAPLIGWPEEGTLRP